MFEPGRFNSRANEDDPSDAVVAKLQEMAKSDPSQIVRLYLASAAAPVADRRSSGRR